MVKLKNRRLITVFLLFGEIIESTDVNIFHMTTTIHYTLKLSQCVTKTFIIYYLIIAFS